MTPRTAVIAVLAVLAIVLVMLLNKSKPPAAASSTSTGEFLSTSNLQAGWQLFTVKGRKAVGLVKKIESDHQFPDGTTQGGVLILFTDATENWVPSTEVAKLYVAKP